MDYRSLGSTALVHLCAENDRIAWEEFIHRYQHSMALAILRVLRRWGEVSTVLLDDLLQETYVVLCANGHRLLRQFVENHPDSLGAMLRVVATNITHDQLRARRSQKRGAEYFKADPESSLLEDASSNAEVEKIEREIQLAEIERVLQKAPRPISSVRDRSIFWLHFRSGLSARAISEIPSVGLTAKGVESSIYRTLDFIRRSFRIEPG
jgi:RNA polymerase sigma-70 factor, ECF subfamily